MVILPQQADNDCEDKQPRTQELLLHIPEVLFPSIQVQCSRTEGAKACE